MGYPKIFTDEADLADDKFTDFEDDEMAESFADFEIHIDTEGMEE